MNGHHIAYCQFDFSEAIALHKVVAPGLNSINFLLHNLSNFLAMRVFLSLIALEFSGRTEA